MLYPFPGIRLAAAVRKHTIFPRFFLFNLLINITLWKIALVSFYCSIASDRCRFQNRFSTINAHESILSRFDLPNKNANDEGINSANGDEKLIAQ